MIKTWLYNQISKHVFPNKGITHIKRTPKLIVSLTSYPKRIGIVHKVINSLLRQSLKPDMLVLWLSEEEFPQKERSLPQTLLRFTKHGLSIMWCTNHRSYNKLIPSLKEFPNDIIVTADDDVIYSENWLECLYRSYLLNPTQIHGHHAEQYTIDDNFIITKTEQITSSGLLYGTSILFGTGGILYPPHSLYKDTTNSHLYTTLASTNDDFWFWAMAHLQETPIRLIDNYCDNIVCIDSVQKDGLWGSINSYGADIQQFQNIIKAYPKLKKHIQASH